MNAYQRSGVLATVASLRRLLCFFWWRHALPFLRCDYTVCKDSMIQASRGHKLADVEYHGLCTAYAAMGVAEQAGRKMRWRLASSNWNIS